MIESTPAVEMAIFPLGSVLLPGMALPLRVFEPRYRVLVDTVLLADEPDFASVLIERGSEVGGGEVRTSIGCVARIVEIARHDDGQVSLLAIGVRRVVVEQWLADDPFPRALVRDWPDESDDTDGAEGAADLGPAIARCVDTVDELTSLAAEIGLIVADPAGAEQRPTLSDDPTLRVYQLATLSPLGPLDRQRVLSTPTLRVRVALLEELLEDQRIVLEAQRGGDGR
ncbi:MAG: LON peptidase substrate-binding domain-containing protein [Microthrixaceae bacterium]